MDGGLYIFKGVSQLGRDWLNEHLQEGPVWCGGHVVEHRYAHDIIIGAGDDGLEVEHE
jgi:hypothetical protein